ncbi:MAG: hypothetical protein A3I66_08785 [Burkholderiales bacterium RIFCSPLOWO2_02_FULL_57_36]|nr:MAG: hypothetical protein A3I66_08785 [Burkholderiales bacterium RIFCSPLOWO2_02_FULL_57_36]
MRDKGLVVVVSLIAYAMFIAVFVVQQKNLLLRDFDEIQQSVEIDGLLKQVDGAIFQSVMATYANIDALDRGALMQRIQFHYHTLVTKHAELGARAPQYNLNLASVNAALSLAEVEPSRINLNQLAQALLKAKGEFAQIIEQAQQSRKQMTENYRKLGDSMVMTALLLGMLGLALLGALTVLFFRRLKEDLHTLRIRAMDIVNGYRDAPLPISRHDEVGQLMIAINNMASTLDTREKELMMERQKYFHQEKMAAIGTLAAGVAHEIGNPIAAISGIAQDMAERRNANCDIALCQPCRPDLIHIQTQRIASITREISEFASHQTVEPQLLDLNGLLRSASALMRYDKRSRRIALNFNLDSQLPAFYGVADQATQVIMNLLVNAMDALEEVFDRPPSITIATRAQNGQVRLSIEDNGCGMDSATLARVFEAFFTTKAVGHGTGLGLSLCYSIMQKNGGSISIDSTLGRGTCVQALFPTTEAAYNEMKAL